MKERDDSEKRIIPQNIIDTLKVMLQPYSGNQIKSLMNTLIDNEPEPARDELLTLKEAADLLKVSKPTLRKYERQGLLRIIKPDPHGHKVFVSRNSIKWGV